MSLPRVDATGAPSEPRTTRAAIDLPAIAGVVDEVEAMACSAAVERVDLDRATYRALLGTRADLAMAVRPTVLDSESVENLAAKLCLAESTRVRRVDFYHYGLMRLDALDRIAAALAAAGQTS